MDEQIDKYCTLDAWFKTSQGIRIARSFESELKEFTQRFNGEALLQLGNCGDNLWLPAFRYRHKWVANLCESAANSTLICSFNRLPIDRNSVDCVIAPLTIEAYGSDKTPIDEIDRILKPMGYVIFLGINPFSFWGASLRWGHLGCFGQQHTTLTSSLSVKRAVLHRDYIQYMLKSFYYIPPVEHKNKWAGRLAFLNVVGKMMPFPAGFYCFIAQKYQRSHTGFILENQREKEPMSYKPSLPVAGHWLR